jgi:peroxiredoxin
MKKLIYLIISTFVITSLTGAVVPTLKPGDNAPDFTLKNVKGEMVSLSGLGNVKGVILVFTSNTCPYARKYEQRIVDLNSQFKAKGFPVVAVMSNDEGVDPDDSYQAMQQKAKEKGYTFHFLRDESQDVAKKYGPTNTPHAFVLLKKGNGFKVEYAGAIDNNVDDPANADKKYVVDAVNALLAGQQVKVTSTKSIGCSIKWKN